MDRFLNKVIHGDCLEVMRDIPTGSIDMVLCDLPYGTTLNKWDTVIPLKPLWEQYTRIIKDSGAIVLTSQPPFDKVLACSNLKMFRYEWIWNKVSPTGHLNARKMPMKKTENILVFYKKLPTYNPQGLTYNPRIKTRSSKSVGSSNYGKHRSRNLALYQGYPTNILEFMRESGFHPTQKPVPLFEYLIKTYTNEKEVVLDNCIGSGTTAIAALNTGRFFIGIEKEPEYVKIARRRIEEVQGTDETR